MRRLPPSGIWAGVGGAPRAGRLNGISHFIEHMLFKGTRRRSGRRIMEEVEGVGGDMNAYTCRGAHLLLRGLGGGVLSPLVRRAVRSVSEPEIRAQSDIERECGVICEEILMYQDEPSAQVQELLNEHYWPWCIRWAVP